ncbi:MAG: type II toxin-antitoxin system RelE/ParE family toxin [Rhabdochlamydiaceae bacterium]
MKYKVEFSKTAEKQLESIPKSDVKRIIKKTEKLATDPFPSGHESIKGSQIDAYRIRQGDYRILYTVHNEKLIVLVVKIGHRREIYRDL